MTVLVGSTSEGTTADFASTTQTAAWGFVAVASGIAKRLLISPKVANAGETIKVGIYANDTGDVPGALLGVVGPFTIPPGVTPYAFDISSLNISIVSGTRYHLALRSPTDFNFQGTSAANAYYERVMDFANPFAGGSAGGVRLAIWLDDVEGLPVIYAGAGAGLADNGGTIAPALPSGLLAGDLMIVAAGARAVATALSVPAGWTLIDSDVSDARALMYAYRRYVVGDTAPSITGFGTGNTIIGQVAAWRNVKNVDSPVHILGSRWRTSGLQNLGPIPGVESPADGVVIFGAFKGDDWTSVADLSGESLIWAEIGEPDSTLGNDGGLVWAYALTPALITPADKTFVVTGGGATAAIGKAFSLARQSSGSPPPAETDNFFHVM